MLYLKPLASCRSPTTLKRPDRSKQCHCLQFPQRNAVVAFLHYYINKYLSTNKTDLNEFQIEIKLLLKVVKILNAARNISLSFIDT